MKKQILILILFVAAIVAGTSNAFGQNDHYASDGHTYLNYLDAAPSCITPRQLTNCLDVDEIHPVQGEPYKYIVNTTDASDDVRWFVINNYDLTSATPVDSLVNSNHEILASTDNRIDPGDGTGDFIYKVTNLATDYNINPAMDGTGVTNTTGTEHAIEITWKYFSGLTTANEVVLLVAVVTGDDACTDNIIVYRIIPIPAFTLDVATLEQAGDSVAGPDDATNFAECVSPIESAVYDPNMTPTDPNVTPGDSLIVDYGENWVYFIVNGANYIDSWRPNFRITYTGAASPVISADWAYAADANTNTGWVSIVNFADATPEDIAVNAIGLDASGNPNAGPGAMGDGMVPQPGGECIVVRVRLDWGTQIEHDDGIGTVVFEVDGVQYDGDGVDVSDLYDNSTVYGDKHYADCTVDNFGGTGHDYIEYDITPRPEIEDAITDPVDTEAKSGDENN